MRPVRTAALLLTMLGLVVVAVAAPAGGAQGPTFTYNAGMNGQKEVPGPGDKDASGHARVGVNTSTGQICWDVRVKKVDGTIVAAHIHVGDRNTAGPVAQGITTPTNGTSTGCVVNASLATAIAANPHNYYVNVHSSVFPGGAVRGQLAGPHS